MGHCFKSFCPPIVFMSTVLLDQLYPVAKPYQKSPFVIISRFVFCIQAPWLQPAYSCLIAIYFSQRVNSFKRFFGESELLGLTHIYCSMLFIVSENLLFSGHLFFSFLKGSKLVKCEVK